MIFTAESVTKYHPDKICDQISDAIVDACLIDDPMSRVAVEAIGGHNVVALVGEVTTKANVDFSEVARKTYRDLIGKDIGVLTNIVKQSPEISQGVDGGGAGDQGIMIGYACNENQGNIPNELYWARKLLEPFNTDGKSQVTIEDEKITDIVLSVQGKTKKELTEYLGTFIGEKFPNVFLNNTGAFTVGGFDADSGCTGRKIVVDAYGPRIPVGGGAFSGKDPTKVDRSGAYMARFMALDIMKRFMADEVIVSLGYVIGKAEPIMKKATIRSSGDFTLEADLSIYDCRPEAIIERLGLRKPIYLETAGKGHFGIKSYPWEQV